MQIWEVIIIGVGLSMDAFAIALCKGLSMRKFSLKNAVIIGLFFGGFQALMPVLGWLLGKQFCAYIEEYDHYVAFGLLLVIGGKMIYDSFKKTESEQDIVDKLDYKELLVMSVATSIDALAVGLTLAFLQTNIAVAATTIGVTTLIISIAGVIIGSKIGNMFRNKAEFIGGVALILIGLKILLEHLGAF